MLIAGHYLPDQLLQLLVGNRHGSAALNDLRNISGKNLLRLVSPQIAQEIFAKSGIICRRILCRVSLIALEQIRRNLRKFFRRNFQTDAAHDILHIQFRHFRKRQRNIVHIHQS